MHSLQNVEDGRYPGVEVVTVLYLTHTTLDDEHDLFAGNLLTTVSHPHLEQ
jgi:hypothetical protein